MTIPKKPTEFDDARLATLTEPITISVRKEVAGQKMPISLPVKPGEGVSGKGWTQDEVKQLDAFLAERWAGGGKYAIAATGANGQQMKWESYYPETKYPELNMGRAVEIPPQQPTIPAFQGANTPVDPATGMQQMPGWLMTVPSQSPYQTGARQIPPWAQQQWAQQGYAFPPGSPYPNFGSPFSTPRPGGGDVEVAKLQSQIERERLENRYKESLDKLGQEMRALQAQQSRPQGKSPEVEALERQLEQMKADRDSDKVAQLIADSNRQTRELMSQMQTQFQQAQAQFQQQLLATQQQTQQQLAARPTGPDPTMMMVIEGQKLQAQAQADSTRMQIEAQREIARMQADSNREAQRTQIGPNQLIEIIGKFNTGAEQQTMVMSKAWEMMMHGVEAMMSVQGPQPHPALELLGQAAQGGLALGGRYIQMKEQQAMAAAQVMQQMQAQQVQAAARQAQFQGVPTATSGVAENDPMPKRIVEGKSQEVDDEEEDEGGDADNGESRPPTMEEILAEEAKLFGPARDPILNLRRAVEGGLASPQQCADAILQGIAHFAQQPEPVPIFELWAQGDLAQLLDVMFPRPTTDAYKEQVIAILYEAAQKVRATMAKQAKPANSQ